jgi:diguanylate cyclase (GGDEF)-like protein
MTHMEDTAPDTLAVLPDPALFRAARIAQLVCVVVGSLAILVDLLSLTGSVGKINLATRSNLPELLTGLFCAASLLASWSHRRGTAALYAQRVANGFAILGAAAIPFSMRISGAAAPHLNSVVPSAWVAVGFVLLALIAAFVDNSHWLLNRVVDLLVCALCLICLLMLSEALFAWSGLFGKIGIDHPDIAAMVCLMALSAAVTLRQAEHGVLSIFLGVGHGSSLARILTPILLILVLAWQPLNAMFAEKSSAVFLGASAIFIAIGILLFLTWRISSMENQIHDLVLRDEATRLFNQRGFFMLAEHALLLAKRTNVPFSVLFIELENLARVHADLGPEASAASLAETGELLRAMFRESDIKGRIGADEFAVAGRFDLVGISVAALRLEAATAARVSKTQGPVPLKFSMGHVTTTDAAAPESLKELLQRAGQVKNRLDFQVDEMRVN